MRMYVVLLFVLLAVSCWNDSTCAEITLDVDFDSGALDLANSTVDGTTISLRGLESSVANPDVYRWLYFRASGVAGVQPSFQIGEGDANADRNEFGGSLEGHSFIYSYDQVEWFRFDNSAGSVTDFRFSNDQPFTGDEVYIAYSVPYPFSRTTRKVAEWANSAFVAPTPSADDHFVLGSLSNTTNHGPEDLPLYGLSITDVDSNRQKMTVFLAAGNHSGEVGGDWNFEGMVDFVLSDDVRADFLRKNVEFFVYPQLDPLGRVEGHSIGNSQSTLMEPQDTANNHNRFWDAPVSGNNGQFTEIDRYNEAWDVDLGSDVDFSIDFHGFFEPGDPFLFTDAGGSQSVFAKALVDLEPGVNINVDNSTTPAGILEFWMKERFGANFSFTSEAPPNSTAADHLRVGGNYGIALYSHVLAERGDINRDSTVGFEDFVILRDNFGSRTRRGSSRGDLDGDRQVTMNDFLIFSSNYGVGTAATQAVPEASGTILLLWASLHLVLASRHSRQGRITSGTAEATRLFTDTLLGCL